MSVKDTNDIKNLEHCGEWDHGIEPDVFESTDNEEVEDPKDHPVSVTLRDGFERFAMRAKTTISKVLHDLDEKAAEGTAPLRNDAHFMNEIEHHTEEEVAVTKLCVSKAVRQESFEAPC